VRLSVALDAAGGLALFLLAMQMMTEGLKAFAGGGLKRLLGRWTSSPARGVLAGILVTGLVQSSSAVTVATIGFVNAGLLTLRQALGVVFGTNVGTTMTGWLVSLVGFGFKIESFALPILALGVVLRLAAAGKRPRGLGEALAGFGLFFLGLGVLKGAFAGLADAYGASVAGGGAAGSVGTFLLVGFVATVLTQSSSAAIALILTAAAGGVVGLRPAAAAVIGANLGTTSTAAFAVLRATPAARRLALGHIVFNLVTAVVALLLLPLVLGLVDRLADALDVEGRPAAFLALFHTVFNVLGVALLLPFADRLASGLERLFRGTEEDLSRPQHLDSTLAATPELAVPALREELVRLRALAAGIVGEAASGGPADAIARKAEAARALGASVSEFVASVRTESMPRDVADELARSLRIQRSLLEAARLAERAARLREPTGLPSSGEARRAVAEALAAAGGCASFAGQRAEPAAADEERAAAVGGFREAYERAKSALLSAVVSGDLSVENAGALLDDLSATRRAVEQLVEADRALRRPAGKKDVEPEDAGLDPLGLGGG
jgi:phosphate:Na+ symporter